MGGQTPFLKGVSGMHPSERRSDPLARISVMYSYKKTGPNGPVSNVTEIYRYVKRSVESRGA